MSEWFDNPEHQDKTCPRCGERFATVHICRGQKKPKKRSRRRSYGRSGRSPALPSSTQETQAVKEDDIEKRAREMATHKIDTPEHHHTALGLARYIARLEKRVEALETKSRKTRPLRRGGKDG